ncbi:hypothetical protein ACENF1_004505 [Vibrio parahaemolyticus]
MKKVINLSEQKIRYLVTQNCSNDKHNGALGVVSIASKDPRRDEQLLISQVESCNNCKFHSMFYPPEEVAEIKRSSMTPTWVKRINRFLAKLGFLINTLSFLLIIVWVSLSDNLTIFGENFEKYAVTFSIAGLCLAAMSDENATTSTKLTNLFALAIAVVYLIVSFSRSVT